MSQQTINMLKSWVGTFAAAAIAALLAVLVSTKDFPTDGTGWKAIGIAGLLAVLPVIRNYFDSNYTGYGKGSTTE